MRIMVACEFSGIVRDEFIARGHDAVSCDVLPSERTGPHIIDDVRNHLNDGWDMMIAFPPCTHLAVSGARWFHKKQEEQRYALQFVRDLMNAPIPRIAIENPVSIISTYIRKPDQIIQPWQYGHGETKTTCLWLTNLPQLTPTNIVNGRESRIHNMSPSADRWRERSRTFLGVAEAMASQWGELDAIAEAGYTSPHVSSSPRHSEVYLMPDKQPALVRTPRQTKRGELVDLAKRLVLTHGPVAAIDNTVKIVEDAVKGLNRDEAYVKELTAEIRKHGTRVLAYLGYSRS